MSATVVYTERAGGAANDIRSALAAALAAQTAAEAAEAAALSFAASAAGVAAVPFVITYFADGATTTIPVEREIVLTKGYSTKGIGAARYIYDATVDATYVTANPYTAFISANGRGFKLYENIVGLHMFGARGDGATNQATRINAWIAYLAANGKAGVWNHDTAAWRTQTVTFVSNVQISIEPNTTIEAASGAVRVFQFGNGVQNCMVLAGPNVVLDGRGVATSSIVYMVGAKNIWMQNITAKGAVTGKDAWYFGNGDGTVNGYCEHIQLGFCKGDVAGRNSISIVSCVDFYALECDFTGAGSAPGAGCDVEANNFNDVIRRITFEKCKFHDNGTYGAVVEFGTDCTFIDCDFYANQNSGFGMANGGAALSVGVRRANVDIVAVTAVTAGTGKLTLSSTAALRVGMICLLGVRSGGVLPTGAPTGRAIIYDISGNDIRFWNDATTGPTTSYSDAGSGTLTSDPETSAIYVSVYQDGASNNVKLINSRIYGNCISAGTAEVAIATCADLRMEGCEVTATKAGVYGVNITYSRKLRIRNNHILSTVESTGTAQGLHFGLCYDVIEEGNSVRGFSGNALNWGNCPASRFGNGSLYTNCGMHSTNSAIVECTSGAGGRFTGATLRQDANHATTYGAYFSGWTAGYINDCDFTGVATSNATALLSNDNTMVVGTLINWDGTTSIGRTGSKTFDAPSIANGASTTTTVTVNGAKLGDSARASMAITIAGLSMTAFVSATNTVTVVLTNNTGSAVDLASTTLYASAWRIAA